MLPIGCSKRIQKAGPQEKKTEYAVVDETEIQINTPRYQLVTLTRLYSRQNPVAVETVGRTVIGRPHSAPLFLPVGSLPTAGYR